MLHGCTANETTWKLLQNQSCNQSRTSISKSILGLIVWGYIYRYTPLPVATPLALKCSRLNVNQWIINTSAIQRLWNSLLLPMCSTVARWWYVMEYSLVVVIHSDGQNLLCMILSNHEIVQIFINLSPNTRFINCKFLLHMTKWLRVHSYCITKLRC